MASTCISNCVDAKAPVRATYVNLYKWPESDVEFIRSLSSNEHRNGNGHMQPKVVDSISCRQLYLRSYTFSRDDELNVDKRKRSCRRFRERVATGNRRKRKLRDGGCSSSQGSDGGGRRKKCTGFRRAKELSCVALAAIFRRLLSCTTKVDVVG